MRFLIFESFIKYMHFHFFLLFQLSAKFVDFGDSLLGHMYLYVYTNIFFKKINNIFYIPSTYVEKNLSSMSLLVIMINWWKQ